jgi:hypothetical protein
MKREKCFYQSMPNIYGFSWVGYWDNFHHFTKQIGDKWAEIRATDIDIDNGNLEDMARLSVTR